MTEDLAAFAKKASSPSSAGGQKAKTCLADTNLWQVDDGDRDRNMTHAVGPMA